MALRYGMFSPDAISAYGAAICRIAWAGAARSAGAGERVRRGRE
jgi:hypothetical protein